MEIYTFTSVDNAKEIDTLRIKSDNKIELVPGFQNLKEENLDCDVIYSFNLLHKIKEVNEGNYFYTWYKIESYSKVVDKNVPIDKRVDIAQSFIDYNVMMGNLQNPEQEEN